jgi:hypothetical protein
MEDPAKAFGTVLGSGLMQATAPISPDAYAARGADRPAVGQPSRLDMLRTQASDILAETQALMGRLNQLGDRVGLNFQPEADHKPRFDRPSGDGPLNNIYDTQLITRDALDRCAEAMSRLEQL